MRTPNTRRILSTVSKSTCLYRAHGYLTQRMFRPGQFRWYHGAALAVVRWCLDRVEMRQLRYGPTQGCSSCRHYERICDACRVQRKALWG